MGSSTGKAPNIKSAGDRKKKTPAFKTRVSSG
jgi:hypothetical protein